MQFYIIDQDPIKSSKNLPDYAIKSVNVREGWQILSDIAHRFKYTFEGQHKAYNPVHPWTRTFSHKHGFKLFVNHYRENCKEYYNRFGKMRKEMEFFADFDAFHLEKLIELLPETQEAETINYLFSYKSNKF